MWNRNFSNIEMQLLTKISGKIGRLKKKFSHAYTRTHTIQKITIDEWRNKWMCINDISRKYLYFCISQWRRKIADHEEAREEVENRMQKKQNCKINWAGRRTVSRLSERHICFAVKSDSYRLFPPTKKKKRNREKRGAILKFQREPVIRSNRK